MQASTTSRTRRARRAIQAAALTAAAVLVAPIAHHAGAAPGASAITDVRIAAKGWTLTAPSRIPAGLVGFTVNGSTNPFGASAIVGEIKPGVAQAQVSAALKTGDVNGILKVLTPVGGPQGTGTPQAIIDLQAGNYTVFDIEQDAKGKPQAFYRFFTVSPSTATVVAPAVTAVITERDMRFKVASTLPAGDVTLQIVNRGPSVHETILAKLHPGATLETLKAYLKQQNPSGPPPADIFGIGAIMAPGHVQYAPAHLTAGTYVLLCFVSDKHGVPHVMDGMIKSFEVR